MDEVAWCGVWVKNTRQVAHRGEAWRVVVYELDGGDLNPEAAGFDPIKIPTRRGHTGFFHTNQQLLVAYTPTRWIFED